LYTQTKHVSSIPLPNVLHVPNMKKNLISVSQLTRDRDLVVEFNSSSCLIKDKNIGEVLLQGCLKDGLYRLSSTLALVASSSSAQSIKSQPIANSTFLQYAFSFANKCKRQLPFYHGLSPNV